MLTHSTWNAIPGLRHGFLDARDCVGSGGWEGILARAGSPFPIAVPRQVHGIRVLAVPATDERPEADGLVVAAVGQLVGVVTADCVPVLLVDRRRHVAAAVHAGWRGAAAGVLEAAVAQLTALHGSAPCDLEVAIGPAVGGCCYEVGPEVAETFGARTGRLTGPAWHQGPTRMHLDQRQAASLLLSTAGVTDVAILGPCTVCGPGYHSFRRDGPGTGRQLSFVGWAPR